MAAAGPTDASASPVAAALAASPTQGQLGFWEQSLVETNGNLLTCMLLHDDEKEAAEMDAGETREIFQLCDFQKEWIVCGQTRGSARTWRGWSDACMHASDAVSAPFAHRFLTRLHVSSLSLRAPRPEWAAGMGRLTPALARQCAFVYASDFVSAFCDTNRARCARPEEGVQSKVQVECIDAAQYRPAEGQPPPHGFDQIDMHFVNWLLLYLDDRLAHQFVHAAVQSLRREIRGLPGRLGREGQSGWIFFHESCWERANESELFARLPAEEQARLVSAPCEKTEDCQTYYRKVYWYDHLFRAAGLEIVLCKELEVYAPTKTFSADGEVEKPTTTGTQPAEEDEENAYYNRQMVWMLRLKQ